MSRWYRAYEGTVNDAKLAEAAMVADVSRAVSIAAWHALLESASVVNNCGSYEITPRRVSIILCEPPAAVEALFAAYAEIGLIKDGVILSWKKRQFQSDDSKERVAKHRAKKAQETANSDNVTACNGDVTAPYTETEADKGVSTETLVDQPDSENEDGLALRPEHLLEAWNASPAKAGAVECRPFKGQRRRKAITFLRKWKVDEITEAIGAVAKSDFLCGRTKEGFRAAISFLFSEEHMERLLEGFYGR